ncbi:MAG: type I polyketide synthase, partial [Mycobacterium sp.]|nr:type I polyketide synthase [Mycobacterium sp.]
VFSGQGSQWAGMGAELLATEPAFAAAVARIEPLVARESGFSVTEAMSAPETVRGIERIQPTLFAMQVGMAEAMAARGVRPGAVIGHSMGEAAAAVVAGALSVEDGVRVICRRSMLLSRLSGSGAMASVELPEPAVRAELAALGVDDVVVAVVASPQTTVIGGNTETVRELVARWEAGEVMAREVAVDVASHSPQVDPILPDLAAGLTDLTPGAATVPYYSATRPDPRTPPECDAAYWVDNLRQPVRFAAAVQAALEDGYRVFGELSPHPLLTRAVEQTAHSVETPVAALAGLRREQPLRSGLLGNVADLYAAGAVVDVGVLYPAGRLVDAPLPAWSHRHLLLERGDGSGPGHRVAAHPLLGAHVRLVEEPERHAWQSDVGTAVTPWLADHRIHDVAAFPAAAYCEMALVAAGQVFGEGSGVADVRFEDLLLLDEHTGLTAVATVDEPGRARLVAQTDGDGGAGAEPAVRATATLLAGGAERPPARDVAAILAAHPNVLSGNEIRQEVATRGIEFGPAFCGLLAVHTASDSASNSATLIAEVAAPAGIRAEQSGHLIHPALLDACFQTLGAHLLVGDDRGGALMLPLGVASLRSFGAGRDVRYCQAAVTKADAVEIVADLTLLDQHGAVVLEINGFRMGSGLSKAAERERVLAERLLTVEWEEHQPPTATGGDAGEWLLLAAPDGALAQDLADALQAAGARCRTIALTAAEALTPAGFTAGRPAGVVVLTAPT